MANDTPPIELARYRSGSRARNAGKQRCGLAVVNMREDMSTGVFPESSPLSATPLESKLRESLKAAAYDQDLELAEVLAGIIRQWLDED